MVRKVSISCEMPEELYEILASKAAAHGRPLNDLIVEWLARHPAKPRPASGAANKTKRRLPKFMGICKAQDPHAADNDRIDADLAKEYGAGLTGDR